MDRNLVLAVALAGVFAAPLSTAFAQSEEDKDKKPEQSQLIVGQSDEKETPKPELIAQDDDQPKKPKKPKPDYAA